MEVSDQPHVPAALPTGSEPTVPLVWEPCWFQEPFGAEAVLLVRSTCSVVVMRNTLSWLLMQVVGRI
jgi:hypothetical protein